jgi:hypothetical protein
VVCCNTLVGCTADLKRYVEGYIYMYSRDGVRPAHLRSDRDSDSGVIGMAIE